MTHNYGLERKNTTNYNPQANGVVERVHAVMGDILRTFELEERELDEDNPWGEFLSSCAFAIRATYHTTLQATPAQLVFGRDMILPIAIQADWARIKERKQEEINRNNRRENRDRVEHTYSPGDKVLLRKEGKQRKLTSPRDESEHGILCQRPVSPLAVLIYYNGNGIQKQEYPEAMSIQKQSSYPMQIQ